MPSKDERKCLYCNQYFDITKEEFVKPRTNRYAHKTCAEKYSTTDDYFKDLMYKYLKEEVKINYDYQACERQRLNFISKLGYTNKGMYQAIRYFYEVKKESSAKSGNRIGIIPYVYDEAQAYYQVLARRQKEIGKVIEKQSKLEPRIVQVLVPRPRKQLQQINLDEIGGEN